MCNFGRKKSIQFLEMILKLCCCKKTSFFGQLTSSNHFVRFHDLSLQTPPLNHSITQSLPNSKIHFPACIGFTVSLAAPLLASSFFCLKILNFEAGSEMSPQKLLETSISAVCRIGSSWMDFNFLSK